MSLDTDAIHREGGACTSCGSNLRFRSIISALSQRLYKKDISLSEFPLSKDIKGLGTSDAPHYADRLAERLGYTNYFYHQEPYLDITNIDAAMEGQCDFAISSDVFEHILPPRHTAFINTAKLLKEGGVFIFSVPYTKLDKTLEHFPRLYDYRTTTHQDKEYLINTTRTGEVELYTGINWHGGEGATLEMRVFCEEDLRQIMTQCGFTDITIHNEDTPQYGIFFPRQPHSFIVSAVKTGPVGIIIPESTEDPFLYAEDATIPEEPLVKPAQFVEGEEADEVISATAPPRKGFLKRLFGG